MFGFDFPELMLVMIVALVVVGPERLPGLARKTGYWIGRFRRYVVNVRAEIERELNADELRSMLTKQEDEIRELRDMLQDTRNQIRNEVDDVNQEVNAVGEQLRYGSGTDRSGAIPPAEAATGHASEAPDGAHAPPAGDTDPAAVHELPPAEAEHQVHGAEPVPEPPAAGAGHEPRVAETMHEPRDNGATNDAGERHHEAATAASGQNGKTAPREAATHER